MSTMSTATECSTVKTESISHDQPPNTPVSMNSSVLASSLSTDRLENPGVVSVFWETVWPILESAGWEKRVRPSSADVPGYMVFATRKGLPVDLKSCREGKDYYVRIADVIDRLNQRRSSEESAVADLYRRAISKPDFSKADFTSTPSFTRLNVGKLGSPKLDLSWKEGRTHFPKASSRIGNDYQVSTFPIAQCFDQTEEQSVAFCELMFHPGDARSKGVILEEGKDIVSALASNLREQALPELAKVIYNEEEFRSIALPNLRPMDGSDWTQEQKEKFHNDIFRYRRDLRAVSKSLGIPLKICQAYYLGTYKTTWEYRLLKSVCIDEREGRAMATDHGPDACSICGGDGSLLICDGCDGEFHMACLRPPLRVVPEGHWLCDDCVDRRVIETRNSFIRNSKLFEKIEGKGTKRTWDGDECTSKEKDADNIMSDLDISSVAVYRPVPAFLEAAREFSMKISKILAKTEDD